MAASPASRAVLAAGGLGTSRQGEGHSSRDAAKGRPRYQCRRGSCAHLLLPPLPPAPVWLISALVSVCLSFQLSEGPESQQVITACSTAAAIGGRGHVLSLDKQGSDPLNSGAWTL